MMLFTNYFISCDNFSKVSTSSPVLILNADTQISDGDDTKENPFIVE